ncbi:MAG: hypothetical protein MRJ68_16085 [Nitrospira sp.]|nr:hypothetical protein [Nitrospira sp.]
MQNTAQYEYLLGLQSPWTVTRLNLEVTRQCVDVWAEPRFSLLFELLAIDVSGASRILRINGDEAWG